MYIHMLREHSISETVNTTRFLTKLIESLPNLYSSRRKDGKTIVIFDQQVDNLIRDYVETPDEFCASLRKVVNLFERHFFTKRTVLMDALNLYANLNQGQKVFCKKAH